MKRTILSFVCTMLVSASSLQAQSDSAAYRASSGVEDPQGKIRALEQFLTQFPQSALQSGAYKALFSLYLDQGKEAASLDAASHYFELLPEKARLGPYNEFAYDLASRNVGLDSALLWASRAEEMARAEGSSMLSAVEDTRAYVLYRLGNFAEAEKLQREAIQGHEIDPEYVAHLALYEQGNGKHREALLTLSRGLYLGADEEMRETFTRWLKAEEADSTRREALKDSIVMTTIHAFVDTLTGEKATAAKSRAAGLLSALGVELPLAQKWAEEAFATLGKDSSPDDIVAFKENLALVLVARGKDTEGLALLQSIEQIVSPWETAFWMALGKTYEKLGAAGKAIKAYMQGLVMVNPKDLRQALEKVYAKEHGSTDSLDADLKTVKELGAVFNPGRYSSSASGKVILAELFTGAECGPCVGSDLAFDALQQFYPRSVLALLEYHVHIPGPDPLTTNDSWDRFQFYKGGGTPTAVIDGNEKMLGGGPKYIARNRFNLYRFAIEKHVAQKPPVHLSLVLSKEHDQISCEARIEHGASARDSGQLHIALVERSVDYTGGNGISRQSFVVRKLAGGSEGTSVALKGSRQKFTQKIDLREVEKEIQKLLDDPRSQISWPKRLKNFTGWRARPEKIDRANLAVIAWVQDTKTHEVLQAAYQNVSAAMSTR